MEHNFALVQEVTETLGNGVLMIICLHSIYKRDILSNDSDGKGWVKEIKPLFQLKSNIDAVS